MHLFDLQVVCTTCEVCIIGLLASMYIQRAIENIMLSVKKKIIHNINIHGLGEPSQKNILSGHVL